MTSRQVRRERRAAERKAKKAELKRLKAADTDAEFVSQNPDLHIAPRPSRECEPAVPDFGFVSQNGIPPSKRAEINRLNAQYSTGPRTPNGKLASSRNSLKHGLASGTLIVSNEDPASFEALSRDLIDAHQPANATEELLVTQMAQSWWLAQRAIRLQNDCFTEDGVDEKRLSLFLRYQTTHERAFHKALNALIRLKQTRAREEVVGKFGFVSQNRAIHAAETGFVSHGIPDPLRKVRFLAQNGRPEPQKPILALAEAV